MTLELEIGARIKERRILQGFSQEELANLLLIRRWTISSYESGDSTPNGLILREMSIHLRCTSDYLLCNSDTIGFDSILTKDFERLSKLNRSEFDTIRSMLHGFLMLKDGIDFSRYLNQPKRKNN